MTAPTPNADLAYTVTFERIGRNHYVPAQEFKACHADELAEKIYRFGKRYLGSREVEVIVDLEQGTGWFSCGGRNGGRFEVAEIFGPHPASADRWSAMIPDPHPMANCGPLLLPLLPGAACPTCGTVPQIGEEMQPPPCADHEQNELNCPACSAQRRAFYAALGHEDGLS